MGRSLEQIRAARPQINRKKMRATTEEDIRRHAIEDGQDPDAPLTGFVKRQPGQRGPGKKPPMVPVTLRVEPAMLKALRALGPNWQTRVRKTLGATLVKGAQTDPLPPTRDGVFHGKTSKASARKHAKEF